MDSIQKIKTHLYNDKAIIAMLSGLIMTSLLFFTLLINTFPVTTNTQASQPGQYCAILSGQCMASQGCAGQGGYNIGKHDCPGATICCRQFPLETPTPTPSNTPTPTSTPTPIADKRVFVTSQTFNGNLGGIAGADDLCQNIANTANLGGNWKSWLSVGLPGLTDPDSRMFHSPSAYELVNGTLVASNWSDLIDQNLSHSINMDEYGQTVVAVPNNWNVWTNTWTSGTVYDTVTNLTCDNFTSSSSSMTGRGGTTGATNYTWTAQATPGGHACNLPHHIYCFEQ